MLQKAFIEFVKLIIAKSINISRLNDFERKIIKRIYEQQRGVIDKPSESLVYELLERFSDELKSIKVEIGPRPKVEAVPASNTGRVYQKLIGVEGTFFIIQFPYSKDIYNDVKPIKEAKYIPEGKIWKVPVVQAEAVLQLANKHSFTFTAIAEQKIGLVKNNISNSYSSEFIDLGLNLKIQPYPFQTQGIKYAMENRRVIIADQMGLGKTMQGIGGVLGLDAFPCLVICPKSLKLNWASEWHNFTYKKTMVLSNHNINEFEYHNKKGWADVAITNYDSLEKFFVEEKKETTDGKTLLNPKKIVSLFKSIIVDESHEIRNPKTIRHKVVRMLARKKETVILLTGTPVVNTPSDLWALIDTLGRGDEFGGHQHFSKVYGKISKKDFDNPEAISRNSQALHDLNRKLRMSCFIRREKHKVLTELPEKVRQVMEVEIPNRKEYDHAFISLQSYLIANGATDEKISSALRSEVLVKIGLLKQIAARGKIEALTEFIHATIAEGEKLIVFVWFLETYREIVKRFPKAVAITGEQNDEQVQHNKHLFQNDPNTNLIVVSYKRGGVGHTLTAASKVAFIELGWNPKDQNQAEDRAHRIGQKSAVVAYYFLAKDTVDETIYQIIKSKDELGKQAVGSDEDIKTEQIDTSGFKQLLASIVKK